MALRQYQDYAVQSLYRYFQENDGNPVVAMPTGTGKSHVIGSFIKGIFAKWPTQRVMMLTHVKELIEQNANKLIEDWASAPLGFFSAGLKKKQAAYPITFAGIQSCGKCPNLFGKVDIVIIDECHLVGDNDQSLYLSFLAALKEVNPFLKVIGLTATPYRLGLGLITDGPIFDDVCCDMTDMASFNWFIDEGYLSSLVPKKTNVEVDLTGVKIVRGEYKESEQQEAFDRIATEAIAEALVVAHDRKRILVFASGIEQVERIAELLEQYGETVTFVHSKMKKLGMDREVELARHRNGECRWLVNNGILTTGYDDPAIDCIVMLRATNSPGLWVQMLGRGTRPFYYHMLGHNGGPALDFDLSTAQGRLASIAASDKTNCLVLDFAGNTMRLGPINDVKMPKKKGAGDGEPPIKVCQDDNTREQSGCGVYNHPTARTCFMCGAEFIFKPKITKTSGSNALIRRTKDEDENAPIIEELDVDTVLYEPHTSRASGQTSMRVIYRCGRRKFSEYVPAWHDSGVKYKGKKWWDERTDQPLPDTPQEACEMSAYLLEPKKIRVWTNKKFPEVMGCLF